MRHFSFCSADCSLRTVHGEREHDPGIFVARSIDRGQIGKHDERNKLESAEDRRWHLYDHPLLSSPLRFTRVEGTIDSPCHGSRLLYGDEVSSDSDNFDAARPVGRLFTPTVDDVSQGIKWAFGESDRG